MYDNDNPHFITEWTRTCTKACGIYIKQNVKLRTRLQLYNQRVFQFENKSLHNILKGFMTDEFSYPLTKLASFVIKL